MTDSPQPTQPVSEKSPEYAQRSTGPPVGDHSYYPDLREKRPSGHPGSHIMANGSARYVRYILVAFFVSCPPFVALVSCRAFRARAAERDLSDCWLSS